MGRVKLKIQKLENTNGRQATFAKRKHGIMKKANELSILCDIDIILLMFSPTGKPSICSGKRSGIEEVIAKYARVLPRERVKRKLESLEALKRTFKKLDHDVNISEFLGSSAQTVEDLTNQAGLLQTQLSEIHRKLSHWTDPDKINSVEHLRQMEHSLEESLNRIRTHKSSQDSLKQLNTTAEPFSARTKVAQMLMPPGGEENMEKQQLTSLECTSQFQNGLDLPFGMGTEQQLQPSWIPNNDTSHLLLPEDPNLCPQRDLECSASSSFGSYSGYFGTSKGSEMSNSGQESGFLNDLSGAASHGLHLSGQFPYVPYYLNFLSDTKFQPIHENQIDYQVNGSLETHTPVYNTARGSWASPSRPCAVTMFDKRLYAQHPN